MHNNYFLLGIDLEDTSYSSKKNARKSFTSAVYKYLDLLENYNMHATFFTVGETAKRYPELIKDVYSLGHEIACHSNRHAPIEKQTKKEFRIDLNRNLEILHNIGERHIKGYRAPFLSLTKETKWIYKILSDLGFSYSSSVLPAKNAYYGYKNFSKNPTKVYKNLVEFPITLNAMNYPLGGVYFRTLPYILTKIALKKQFKKHQPVISYIHPYDTDSVYTKFHFPNLEDTIFNKLLMRYNRGSVLPKINKIMKMKNTSIVTYSEYLNTQSFN